MFLDCKQTTIRPKLAFLFFSSLETRNCSGLYGYEQFDKKEIHRKK